ncbi:MAG: hypothetical protein EBR47_03665 [Betaproteobacteria bacterium]|nr:hypothetical protein [Betaproteobacteria bacterium]
MKQLKSSQGKSRLPDRGVKVQFPATEFELAVEAWLSKLEVVKKDVDKRWGTDRLQKLADANFMEKFREQEQRVWQACQDKDKERLEKSAAGMVRAYQALEAWGIEHAVPVRPAVGAVEHLAKDGSVMVVVATKEDAVWYRENRPEVDGQHVWTMDEIELLIQAEINQAVVEAKIRYAKFDPVVVKVEKLGGATGFDDFVNDLDLSEPDKSPKMFDSKTAEKFKHGQNRAI